MERCTATDGAAADPERAATARAYMKDFPYLGIPAPEYHYFAVDSPRRHVRH